MVTQRILVIGTGGQVGWELCRALAPLADLVPVDYPEIDLTNAATIQHWIRKVSPDIIINAAAHTAVDQAESEPDAAMAINGIAPGVMAEEARRLGALLVHYSTDYVFDGTASSPYREDDVPRPLSVYGRTKLAGERAVVQAGGDHLIFRLCWVYGLRGRNFLLTMLRLIREREHLRVVRDQIGSPTWSRAIAEATVLALTRKVGPAGGSVPNGIYHLCASGQTSWHGFAEAIMEFVPEDSRKCKAIEAITTDQYPTPAQRPAQSVLSTDKFEQTFGFRLPDWKASLKTVFEQLPP